jgi:hypothetical protein
MRGEEPRCLGGTDRFCPEDADDWAEPGTQRAYRQFTASRHVIDFDLGENFWRPWTADIEVRVEGIQYGDGRVRREVVVDQLHPDNPITLEQAEQLTSALVEATRAARAANAVDGLWDTAGTIGS